MKTKRKEKVKKRRKEKKRSERKKRKTVIPGIEQGAFDVSARSFTTRLRGTHNLGCRNFIIKTFEPYLT